MSPKPQKPVFLYWERLIVVLKPSYETLTSLQTSGAKSVVTVVRTLVGFFTGPTALAKLVASFVLVIATARSAVKGDGKMSCDGVAVGSCALSLVLDLLADILRSFASS